MSPAPAPDTLELPAHLGGRAAAPLARALLERRGRNLRLDGSGAGAIGAQCLQVVLAAEMSWTRDGCRIWIAGASAELLSSLVLLGVPTCAPLLQPE